MEGRNISLAASKFQDIATDIQAHLNVLYDTLIVSDYQSLDQITNINGIYVFFENDIPQYVGRTNNERMKRRLSEHCAPYSNKNSASFAFKIAKEIKGNPELSDIETYDEDFLVAKQRVAKMKIKYVEVDDPIIQTILEPYVAFQLNTLDKYNSFMAH